MKSAGKTCTQRGGGLLAREIATDVQQIGEKAPIIGEIFAENPAIMDKYWVILKENRHFLPQVEVKFSWQNRVLPLSWPIVPQDFCIF